MEREKYYFWFSCMTVISPSLKEKLLFRAGDVEELFQLAGADLFRLGITPTFQEIEDYDRLRTEDAVEKQYETMQNLGIRFVSMEHPEYPKRLSRISVPPSGLFIRGRLPDPALPSAGIIGARRCSTYGKEQAHFFGKSLAAAGVSVISGMALGIDGMAGTGALASSNESFAVLGNGLDICYPRENLELFQKLIKNGGLLSERPPGYYARPFDFPLRNRIIAGLSDVLLVIEAASKSGSMITVNEALSQGKDVFSLPGRVNDYLSSGCNDLLKSGAQVLTCPEDVLQYLGIQVAGDHVRKPRVSLTPDEKAVFDLVQSGTTVDVLLEKSGLPLSVLLDLLIHLEVKGLIRKEGLSGYIRN